MRQDGRGIGMGGRGGLLYAPDFEDAFATQYLCQSAITAKQACIAGCISTPSFAEDA